jgi:glucose 1-dehydrogenase
VKAALDLSETTKMRLKDKVVLVTGSESGIGLTTAIRFAEQGAAAIVHGPSDSGGLKDALARVAGINANSIKLACDLADSDAIRRMFEEIEARFGRLDVLVNNAAAQNEAPFLAMSERDWDYVLAVNLKAPFLCSQLAARMMARQGSGKIVNIGSVHEYQPRRHYAHYTAAKGGLLMLTKSMALELARHNIQVNQVAPGAIATRLTDPARQQQFLTAVPAGRVGATSDVAALIVFLASTEADYITGVSCTVDGGLTLGFCASRPDL